MKLLVTGGAGFIGSNFIRYWLKKYQADSIINFDALTYAGNLENLRGADRNPRYQFIKGDITDSQQVTEAAAQADIIVHFAAESHVDRSILDPEAFVNTNVVGTYRLLEAARQNNIRFHHVSTDEVYGSLVLDTNDRFNEQSPYRPNSPYSASKAGSDHLVRAYFKTYGLPVTISNTSNNFGPYQFPEKLIPLAITNLLEGKKVPVYTPGNQVRDWIYVDDHCIGIDLIINRGKPGETYLLGGETQTITNLDLVKRIIRIMGADESNLEMVADRPGHDVRYSVDWSKARSELGYQPKANFEENLNATIKWYQENQAWWQRVKSGEYQDYYQEQYGNKGINQKE